MDARIACLRIIDRLINKAILMAYFDLPCSTLIGKSMKFVRIQHTVCKCTSSVHTSGNECTHGINK